MPKIEAVCSLITVSSYIVGIGLVPEPEYHSEKFCASFAFAFGTNKADIVFEDGVIIFKNEAGVTATYDIVAEDAADLMEVLTSGKTSTYRYGILTPGFLIGMPELKFEDIEEKHLPTSNKKAP